MSDNMTEGINLIVLLAAVLFAFGVFVNKHVRIVMRRKQEYILYREFLVGVN